MPEATMEMGTGHLLGRVNLTDLLRAPYRRLGDLCSVSGATVRVGAPWQWGKGGASR